MDKDHHQKDDVTKGVAGISLNVKKPFESFTIRSSTNVYECFGRTGKGSFGVVYKATVQGTGTTVAIKKVLQDPNYKNRELQIMKMLKHPNIVEFVDSFYQRDKDRGEVFLNLILGYMPENLNEVTLKYTKEKKHMPLSHIQAYIWQLCRALGYIHKIGICHRDIKPQNLLVNSENQTLRLCDFGSAKILVRGEQNVSYICSRFYRAPELIFNATFYTTAIDIWSTGCVMSELILGTPLFTGESGVDQLVEIIKVLGTPNRQQIFYMNPNHKEKLPYLLKKQPWEKLFPADTPQSAIDLISKMLRYTPQNRVLPMEALSHSFFREWKVKEIAAVTAAEITPHLDFSGDELEAAYELGVLTEIFPPEELVKLSSKFTISKPAKNRRVIPSSHSSSSSSSEEVSAD